jgi:hypothetical protein
MAIFLLGKADTIADKLAPAGASLAWFEMIGNRDEDNFPSVDEAFSRRAFAAVAAAEGKTVMSAVVLTGSEIHQTLEDAGKASPVAGAMFIRRYLLQYA